MLPIGASSVIAIVGAGQAGVWAAHTLRNEGFEGSIVLLGDEGLDPYERPPLSKAVLLGTAEPESTKIFSREALVGLRLDFRSEDPVARLDVKAKRLHTVSGAEIGYDRMILCCGGRARPLSLAGGDLHRVHYLRNVRDATMLGGVLRTGTKVVVIGGGWIGLEVAAAARSIGLEVTLLESQRRLCERTVPEALSAELLELHASAGTAVCLGIAIDRLEARPEGGVIVRLSDGRSLLADSVVVGIGLIPNDELASQAGLAVDRGVIVDHQCRTSNPDVFAAGDVTMSANSWFGGHVRLESWQNAQDQGIAAARAALGKEVHYDPLPYFWSDQFDRKIQIFGFPSPRERYVQRKLTAADASLRFFVRGRYVVSAVGVNAGREMRAVKRLIERRVEVDDAALGDPKVDLQRLMTKN